MAEGSICAAGSAISCDGSRVTTILVTGASGFVGSWYVPALLDAGHSIHALVRSDEARDRIMRRLTAEQRGRVLTVPGDVTMPGTLRPALQGADAVVHLVAIARDRSCGRDLERVNLGGTVDLIEAMRATGVRRLVHQGALGVTDDPRLHYGRSKARAEAAVAASDLDWTILKPSLLFGERDGFFNLIAGLVRMPVPAVPIPARQTSRFQPLWVGDAARVVVDALVREDVLRGTYELGGRDRVTYREMVEEVVGAMGKRRMVVPVPLPLIRFVARSSEAMHLPFPVATDQLRQLAFDNVTAADSVRRDFGIEPRPMRGGLGYLRRSMREQDPVG